MAQPLAERLRPKTLDDYIGQKHLVGPGAVLRKMIDAGRISSFILWGPPGVGKTTLAQIIANKLETPFYTLSAVTSGVKDVRDVIEKARSNRFFSQASPILFIDEIHRFSKSQQDSLLGAVETGVVTLIGATTENPSFEVIRPLLSRCQLYVLKSLEKEDLLELLHNAIAKDVILKEKKIELKETDAMLRFSGGDARKLLNILELVVEADADAGPVVITDEKVTERLQQNPLAYDKDGEMHYDIIMHLSILVIRQRILLQTLGHLLIRNHHGSGIRIRLHHQFQYVQQLAGIASRKAEHGIRLLQLYLLFFQYHVLCDGIMQQFQQILLLQ